MTEIKIYCDRCGKALDTMSDYTDIEIEICYKTHRADLCAECFEKLNDIVEDFLSKGRIRL
jgi:ribosomal protein L31